MQLKSKQSEKMTDTSLVFIIEKHAPEFLISRADNLPHPKIKNSPLSLRFVFGLRPSVKLAILILS